MSEINCSVTVMPVDMSGDDLKIGFIRRDQTDTLPGRLVAPGGKVEPTDGEMIEGVPYFSVEHAAVRELKEETGMQVDRSSLFYFCSLTLPNGRVVISMWLEVNLAPHTLTWLTKKEIEERDDFAPGMKEEALMLMDTI